MKPITFSCEATFDATPDEIAVQILDLERWPEFKGYGVIPGIKQAEFEIGTPEIVGTRIHVTNTDGSSYINEIVEWDPETRVTLEMKEFTGAISGIAARFEDRWEFESESESTRVIRTFRLYPKSLFTRPALSLISGLLKKAICQHLEQIRETERI